MENNDKEMKTDIQEALEFANFRRTARVQIEQNKAELKSNLIYSIGGGRFTVSRELIVFVDMLIRDDIVGAVLLDDNDVPIDISDLEEFREDIMDVYFTSVSQYANKYKRVRTARSVNNVAGAR